MFVDQKGFCDHGGVPSQLCQNWVSPPRTMPLSRSVACGEDCHLEKQWQWGLGEFRTNIPAAMSVALRQEATAIWNRADASSEALPSIRHCKLRQLRKERGHDESQARSCLRGLEGLGLARCQGPVFGRLLVPQTERRPAPFCRLSLRCALTACRRRFGGAQLLRCILLSSRELSSFFLSLLFLSTLPGALSFARPLVTLLALPSLAQQLRRF